MMWDTELCNAEYSYPAILCLPLHQNSYDISMTRMTWYAFFAFALFLFKAIMRDENPLMCDVGIVDVHVAVDRGLPSLLSNQCT